MGGQSSTWPGLAKKNQLSCSKESQASDRTACGQALKSFFPLFITVQKDPGDSFCGDAVTLCPLSQESEGRLCPKSILTDSGINSWGIRIVAIKLGVWERHHLIRWKGYLV